MLWYLFDSLTLAGLEKRFREFSQLERVKMSPPSLRHTGPSHDYYHNKATIQDLQSGTLDGCGELPAVHQARTALARAGLAVAGDA